MKVKELMAPNPLSCTVGTNLAAVAKLMWDADCGVLPITDVGGTVTGILTDRDICIAVAARDRLARQILAGAVAVKPVHTCGPDDDVAAALQTMREQRVRRLPVVDARGVLVGMVSWSDAALMTGRSTTISASVLLDTYRAICEHRLPKDAAQPVNV